MHRSRLLSVPFVALAVLSAACGGGDDADSSADAKTRTVEIEMVDIAFEPTTVSVAKGETVRFVFTNTGAVPHDAFLGDTDAQDDHEKEMSMGGADEGHGSEHTSGDTNAITVKPGKKGELTHTFDEVGTLEIGCHQPGHYAGGMKLVVEVS